ncbi:MAG: addiction module protein [Candidatus Sulfotelmatobacter sp.]
MSPELDELLKKAMSLPPEDRGSLAASLLESLDEANRVDQDVEAAWQHEIARRMDEIQTGKVKAIAWPEVRRRARALLNSK